jgi:hypothetical protein
VSVTRLPSGRWRAQVYDPATGKNLSVSKVVGGPTARSENIGVNKPSTGLVFNRQTGLLFNRP